MLAADGLDAGEREPFVRIAAALKRPRHLILLETAREQVREEDLAALNELRRALDAGELGGEGFQTALRLGGGTAGEVKRILFRPPPREEPLGSVGSSPSAVREARRAVAADLRRCAGLLVRRAFADAARSSSGSSRPGQ